MEDILLIADLHGHFGKLGSFMDLNPDAILIAGDITNMGPVDQVESFLSKFEVPSFAVPGNCDRKEILQEIEKSDTVGLHGTAFNLGKRISLAGVGGSNPTPFNTPFEMTDKQIDDLLQGAMKRMNVAVHNILLTHAPPFETLDEVNGLHVGSMSLRKHMNTFDLVCCAHIHEQRGLLDLAGLKVVNPGAAMDGYCAMLHLGQEAKEITVELLKV